MKTRLCILAMPLSTSLLLILFATRLGFAQVNPNASPAEAPKRWNTTTKPAVDDYLPMPIPQVLARRVADDLTPVSSAGSLVTFDLRAHEEILRATFPPPHSPPPTDARPGGPAVLRPRQYHPADDDGGIGPRDFGSLTEVTDPTLGRYPTHAKLFMAFRDTIGNQYLFQGSGTLIDPETVITAGHNVYLHTAEIFGTVHEFYSWAEGIFVVPAYDGLVLNHLGEPTGPYGNAWSDSLHSWTAWTQNQDHDHDIGVIVLDRPVGGLGGYRGYGYHNDCDFFTSNTWVHNGYPAGFPYDGEYMYTQSGWFDGCEYVFPLWYGNEVWFNRTSYPGQSGSAAVRADNVYAVMSNVRLDTGATNDTRLTASKFADVGGWIADNTPSSFDLIPLDVNLAPSSVEAGASLSAVNCVIHNYSSASWSGSVSISVYLSTNDNISTSDTLLVTDTVAWTWAPKSSVFVPLIAPQIPSGTAPGDYWLGVNGV